MVRVVPGRSAILTFSEDKEWFRKTRRREDFPTLLLPASATSGTTCGSAVDSFETGPKMGEGKSSTRLALAISLHFFWNSCQQGRGTFRRTTRSSAEPLFCRQLGTQNGHKPCGLAQCRQKNARLHTFCFDFDPQGAVCQVQTLTWLHWV
jgi:hypothetical protein